MTAIEFNHIGKQYALGTIGTGTLSHDLNRWWASIRGKEDPYLKIGEENDRTKKSDSGFVWALKDIDFKVEQGEVLGIIGKNGAGKSTLLKILSRVTSPTTGSIKARGRIASLLEVGTGFHPEMTGRENIFMNGNIMGMTKAEIKSKLDEIVDFAGVAKYLDTPVKRYSSGMMVRLGFAIAAHLEPEILVVDEVLAVGDAEFQKKAIGKMQDVSKGEGRTVLFVSHNMAAVKSLCTKAIVLNNGCVSFDGKVPDSINYYLNSNSNSLQEITNCITHIAGFLKIHKIKINGTDRTLSTISSNQKFLSIEIDGYSEQNFKYDVILTFKNKDNVPLMSLVEGHYKGLVLSMPKGNFHICKKVILPHFLAKGDVILDLVIHHPNVEYLLQCPNCQRLHIDGNITDYGSPLSLDYRGIIGLETYSG